MPYRNAVHYRYLAVTFSTVSTKYMYWALLTHWGQVTHICVSDLTIIGSDNGLSPGRRQVIIRIYAGILLIRPLGTNFSEILIESLLFSFKKMRLKVSSAKRWPFCLGLNVFMPPICTHFWVDMKQYGSQYGASFNNLRPKQNGRNFADGIFKCIFLI